MTKLTIGVRKFAKAPKNLHKVGWKLVDWFYLAQDMNKRKAVA